MKKSILLLFALLPSFAVAQLPYTGAYFSPATPNTVPKMCTSIAGFPVYCPSLLTDNGTQLLYNGVPVGGNTSPGGSTTQAQFYGASGFAGSPTFLFNTSTGTASYFQLANPGTFSNTANYFPNATTLNGCNPSAIFTAVQYTQYLTAGLTSCATGPTNSPGSAYNQTAGLFAIGTTGGIGSGSGQATAVGGSLYGIITGGNGASAWGGNLLAQDVNDSATGQNMWGLELDIQPQKAASAYNNSGFNVVGAQIALYNQPGQGGIYGPGLFLTGSNFGSPAYWGYGLDTGVASLCSTCSVLNINAIGQATVGTNFNTPPIFNAYEMYGAGVSEGWSLQGLLNSSTAASPTNDYLLISHGIGTAPGGQTHYFGLANGIQYGIQHSDGTWDVLAGSSATGGNKTYTLDGVGGTIATTASVAAAITPVVAHTTGDLACAVAGDTTIGATSITGVASTSSTMTYTMATVPNYFYPGTIVSSQGNTTTGYNAAPLTVASTTGTTVTVTSAVNPGAGTGGGTLSLYCSNQTNNAVSATPYSFLNTYSVAGNSIAAGSTYQLRYQFSEFSSSSAATMLFAEKYNTTTIWGTNGFITPSNSLSGLPGELSLDITGLSTALLDTTPQSMTFVSATTWATASSAFKQPVTVTTSSTEPLTLTVYFSAATAGNALLLNSLVERP